ncbi:hypothetical protein VW35_13680 [Devosia soli]|uniref:HTH marR-type domain-containing protein n=2 Tax=Devosia soli TaxID=361041 RepID=A0A0F5L664_9HYPH|nr:hypothetical protein VW35_13680 [Devosia soli]
MQHHGLRRANERAVLTVIGFNPGLSNAEIARVSGLAPQTVSAILNDIEAAGLITRGEVLRGRRGQPATPIFLNAEGAYSFGVEIGWRHAELLVIDLHAKVVDRRHLDYAEADLSALPRQLAGLMAEIIAEWPKDKRARLSDIGVCLPATVHSALEPLRSGIGSKDGPTQADVSGELEQLTGLPVTLYNDGNAACWAELIAQPSPRPEGFIYLLTSTYIAGGLIGEGRLWQGLNSHSADLGAILVDTTPAGPRSAHAIASVTALVERLGDAGHAVDLSRIENWDWPALEPVVEGWIEDSAHALARVVYNTNAVVEAGLVVIDTILPLDLTVRLAGRVEHHFRQLPSRRDIRIVNGHLGKLAPALGAAELSLYRRYFSRSLLEKVSPTAR